MTIAAVVIIIALAAAGLWLFAIAPGSGANFAEFKKFDYAHRGLHDVKNGVPENSERGFKLATACGFGMEFDLQLTKDKKIVVHHDHSIKRTCGEDRLISDMTLEELKAYRLFGTDERIPLFSDVLKIVDGRTPLIIELKGYNPAEELCPRVMDELKDYKGLYCVESFDPRIVRWFKKNRPEVVRGQLMMKFKAGDDGMSATRAFFGRNLMTNFLTRPHFEAYDFGTRSVFALQTVRKLFGMQEVSWTIRSVEDYEKVKALGNLCIFEGFLPPEKAEQSKLSFQELFNLLKAPVPATASIGGEAQIQSYFGTRPSPCRVMALPDTEGAASRWLRRIFYFFGLLALGLIVMRNGAALGIMLVLLALKVPKKWKIPYFMPLLFIASMTIYCTAIYFVRTPPESDFATMLSAAQQVADGDFSFQNETYFYRWAYQTAFVLYEGLILKITGSIAAIKLLNAAFLSGINVMIYILARRFVDERAAQSAALLHLATLFPAVMTCVLTNQHISAFFIVLAICVFFGRGKWTFSVRRTLLAGVLMALGNLMRPEAIVVLAGLAAAWVFFLITRKSGVKKNFMALALTAAVYFICNFAASYAVKASGVNKYGLSNNWPEWKFIIGLNQETGGQYSIEDGESFAGKHTADTADEVLEEAKEEELQVIYERASMSLSQLMSLMQKKLDNMWGNTRLGFALGYIKESDILLFEKDGRELYDYSVELDRTVLFSAIAMAVIAMCSNLKHKKEHGSEEIAFTMITLVFFAVFMLIEVQPRYTYLPQIFIYIMAARGITALKA